MKKATIHFGILLTIFGLVCLLCLNLPSIGETTGFTAAATPPDNPDPMLVLTRKWLPNDIFRLLLPLSMDVTNPISSGTKPERTALTISDLRYVGQNGDWKKGRFYALAIPSENFKKPLGLLSGEDLKLNLKTVAQRVIKEPNTPDWLVALSLNAVWSPWHVLFTIESAELVKKDGSTAPAGYVLDAFKEPKKLPAILDLDLSNRDAPLTEDFTLRLNIIANFEADKIVFALVPMNTAHNLQLPGDGLTGYSVSTAGVAEDASLVNFVPHSFTNYVLEQMSNAAPLKIKTDSQTLNIVSPVVTTFTDTAQCKSKCLRFSGKLLRNDGIAVLRAFFDWTGDDLAFQKGRVQNRLCPAANLACQGTEFEARTAIAFQNCKSGKSLNPTVECGGYVNPTPALLRPQSVLEKGGFSLNGKSIWVNLLVQNMNISADGLVASGFCTLKQK